MATPRMALSPRTVQVYIDVDTATKRINVVPTHFVIHKEQRQDVRWICIPDLPFTVDFNGQNRSPFKEKTFNQDQPWSGLAVVNPDPNKVYKYTVSMVGYQVEDPDGVVDT